MPSDPMHDKRGSVDLDAIAAGEVEPDSFAAMNLEALAEVLDELEGLGLVTRYIADDGETRIQIGAREMSADEFLGEEASDG